MKVKMLALAAGPERILHPGNVYDLPRDVAESILAARDANGCKFAVTVDKGTPAKRLPAQPDPEDHPEVKEDDDGWETSEDE